MMFREFERRCAATPDLELSPLYWNNLLPDTAPGYFMWRIRVFMEEYREWKARRAEEPTP